MKQSINMTATFKYLFQDRDWLVKSFIGGLLFAIPIVNFLVVGYIVRMARQVSRGDDGPLPAWVDYDGLFREGLWLGIANFLLALPGIALFILPFFAFFGMTIAATTLESEETVGSLIGLGMLGMVALFAIGALYFLVYGFVSPGIYVNYIRRGTLAACLDVGEIVRIIRRNGTEYVMAWLASTVAGFGYMLAGSIAYLIPCLGMLILLAVSFPASFWLLTVHGHAAGQLLALDDARRNSGPVAAAA